MQIVNDKIVGDPLIELGYLNQPLSWWTRQFKKTGVHVRLRVVQGLPFHLALFGLPATERPPAKRAILRIGNTDLLISKWAGLTGQKSTEIAKRIEAGASNLDAIFPPK